MTFSIFSTIGKDVTGLSGGECTTSKCPSSGSLVEVHNTSIVNKGIQAYSKDNFGLFDGDIHVPEGIEISDTVETIGDDIEEDNTAQSNAMLS